MKKTKRRALYIVAALLGALFVLSCIAGFAACGGGSGEEGDEHEHVWDAGVVVDPTCTEKGYTLQTCAICEETQKVNETNALGHSWGDDEVTAPTCTEGGYTTQTCSRCGAKQTIDETQPTGNHTVTDWTTTKEATCTEDGSRTGICDVCGETVTETVAALGHNYQESTDPNDGYVAATCTTAGTSVKICSRCGDKQTETVEALGHDWVSGDPVAATCTAGGYTTQTCSRCNATQQVNVTEALGHDYQESTDPNDGYSAATCTETGTSVQKCSRCGDIVTDTIPATGHTSDGGKVTKAATIYEAGEKTYTCTVCNQVISTETIPKLEASDYTSNFLTGDLSKVDETYVTYTNWEDHTTSAQFAHSEIEVAFDNSKNPMTYTVSGTAAVMDDDQLKAFWGETGAEEHAGAQYITISFVADAGEKFTITSEKSPNGIKIDGDASDPDDTFYTLVYDVSNWSDSNKGETVFKITDDKGTYPVVIGDIELFTVVSAQEDLFAAVEAGGDVALTEDITLTTDKDEDAGGSHTEKAKATLTIGNGTDEIEVTLDLNGYTLARNTQNSSGYQYNTIHVTKNATLIVTDSSEGGSGVVDVTGNYNEALYNEGTAILEGGLFTRSNENGMVESSNGGDSSYTIENYGDLIIDGATVFNAGDYSTCIRNQYTTDSSNPATLTMISGKVYGGKYAVGSGSSTANRYATFTMTGGTLGGLRSETDALPYSALNNYDQAIITGGTLLGGNGGALDVNGANKPDACVEGVVIFNEDGGTNHTLTIGDEYGNGPEIVYEGINPNAATAEGDEPLGANLTYYEDEETIPAFATGVAVYSGEVDINAGSISCTDTAEDRDYNFMGVYLTNGTLRVSGGTISGDEAIVIDLAAQAGSSIAYEISGGTLNGGIKIYGEDGQEVDVSAYEPGDVVVPGSDEKFTFNGESFDGFSGLDGDNLKVTDESNNEVTYVAGGITVTEIVDKDGTITVVVDGIVANQMTDEQKVAFDASYANDNGEIRFYIAVQIAVNPGEIVTVQSGETSEIVDNTTGTEVVYTIWIIEINQSHFSSVSTLTEDYLAVDLSNFTMSVSVTASDNTTATYTIAFGNVFVPLQAWRCADGKHAVSSWTVTKEETCATTGSQTGVCDYCGEEVTEVIPANGLHAATVYSDGNAYAVYMNVAEDGEEEDYKWCALCETCGEWFEIDSCKTCDIYDFVLVANSEASLNAAIAVAKTRNDIDEEITQILVYGTIEISDDSYVKIDCDNVEVYGLGAESSKIIESAYETSEHSSTAADGVEITGKNVTIRNLTIDGTKLDENTDHVSYEHGLEILDSASNVTLSNCTIIGGTSSGSSAVVLMGSNDSGYVLIENCTLSGYRGLMIERNGGSNVQSLYVTILGGTINGSYYGIHTEGNGGGDDDNVYFVAENATINGKNSLGAGKSFTFINCTFGFGVNGSSAYGSMNTYCDVTLIGCTFLSNNTSVTSYVGDPLVYSSNNYVIQARTADITISLIDCKFVNTYADSGTGTLSVTADNFIYLVGSKSDVTNCYLYFDASDDAWGYIYDATTHTVEHNHVWVTGETDETTGKTTYTCECGATKTEVTGNHVVSATPSSEYVVTTGGDESFTAPTFTITMSNSDDDDGPTTYESIDVYLTDSGLSDSVTWTSSDTSVATVDGEGKVTIIGTGTATITVKFEITELEASYTIYVGETITETEPLIGSWAGTDEVTIEELGNYPVSVDVTVTVTEDGFTLRVTQSSLKIDITIWDNVGWVKQDGEYYIVVEEADGSYDTIQIHYDSSTEQLSTSFEFTFTYIFVNVTVDVENATLSRVTESGSETPTEEEPDDDGDDDSDDNDDGDDGDDDMNP